MPEARYTGSPMGSGNPPGKHSGGYLSSTESGGHFTANKAYRGDMHIGRSDSATDVGNQPKESKSDSLTGLRPGGLTTA